ncbi:hypothetical protein K435DRAFT_798732 [Dendrothele bispora CBS 962.96]|uniref:Uncharacterized protein n=1 Tax=Dendrothele bispora (strain CBS 962.96) TaxID=1314807 RepID=A0A4S8LZH6_DENBC|nr:hypothetical protein K435DRAFT_798732 [Dendrothele bispora CBS 962.96]
MFLPCFNAEFLVDRGGIWDSSCSVRNHRDQTIVIYMLNREPMRLRFTAFSRGWALKEITGLPRVVKDQELSQNILMQKINLNLSHLINPSDTGSQSGNGSFRLQGNAQITNDSEHYMAMQQPPLIQSTITLPHNSTLEFFLNIHIPMYEQDKPVASEPVSSNDGKVMNTYGTANSAQNSDPMRLSLDDSNTDFPNHFSNICSNNHKPIECSCHPAQWSNCNSSQ